MTVNKKLSTAEVQAFVERAFANAGVARLETKLPALADDPVIGELASLDALEYERQRETAAADLGIRVTALDKLVKGSRASADDENAALPHWRVEPWPHPVDGAALLDSNLSSLHRAAEGCRHRLTAVGAARLDHGH
jgi:hypothetical protein